MPIVLFRVDERLIHGQVVVGWGGRVEANHIIVVDDELAASPWEQELYCLGVPPEIEASFVDVDSACRSWSTWNKDPRRTVVLARDVRTVGRLAETGILEGEDVNLGGIHHATGRDHVLPYLFLNAEEKSELRYIASTGAEVFAQDVPGSRRVSLDELLGRE